VNRYAHINGPLDVTELLRPLSVLGYHVSRTKCDDT
ncbi:MAG: hypothetical protein QOD04_5476, partial [Pseudonocardiales bacterium]|nr:hypothetical protein [Pseudonocardiales bacterium]